MQSVNFDDVLENIRKADPRYDREAYNFLREALDYTQKKVTKSNQGKQRHVTGQELLEGIREYSVNTFGPMTMTMMDAWGISRCEDFGEIVFNMIDHKLLGKTDRDSREDFKSIYTFQEAFVDPFLPTRKQARKPEPDPSDKEA